MKFRRNGISLLNPGNVSKPEDNFPMRRHASDFNISSNGNYPSERQATNERSVSHTGSRANSRASSPGGGRRVTICEVVRRYSNSTRYII